MSWCSSVYDVTVVMMSSCDDVISLSPRLLQVSLHLPRRVLLQQRLHRRLQDEAAAGRGEGGASGRAQRQGGGQRGGRGSPIPERRYATSVKHLDSPESQVT